MRVYISNPELQAYVARKVESGEFPSADVVVADALWRMVLCEIELTKEDWTAIAEGEAQIDRGEYVEWDVFAAELRAKYGTK
jgi:hypothetical protein